MKQHSALLMMILGAVTALVMGEVGLRLAGAWIPQQSLWPTVETELKSEQLTDLGTRPDVVLVGSSVTEAAVDPEMLSYLADVGLVYNSALPFSSPLANEAWFKEVLSGVEPGLLIVGISVWPIHGDSPSRLSTGIHDAINAPPLIKAMDWSALIEKRGVLADWDRLQARRELKSSGWWTDLGHQTGYYDRVGESLVGRFGPYGEPRMSDDQREGLRRMIEAASETGAEVVLILEPGRFPGPVSDEDIAEYIDWVDSLADQWEIEFWDTYSVNWDASLYSDEVHFNRAGTVAYTEYLAELLKDFVTLE